MFNFLKKQPENNLAFNVLEVSTWDSTFILKNDISLLWVVLNE
jgi:hypothetical protein